jgi:hypothetical protein
MIWECEGDKCPFSIWKSEYATHAMHAMKPQKQYISDWGMTQKKNYTEKAMKTLKRASLLVLQALSKDTLFV